MTGFSKIEVKEKGYIVTVELKSLNGRYLEISSRLHRNLTSKEFEIRDMVKKTINRGNIYVHISINYDESVQPFGINIKMANQYFSSLKMLKSKLKIKENINFEHLLHFSNDFIVKEDNENANVEWRLAKSALNNAILALDNMRSKEGERIARDINSRMKKISQTLEKVDALGIKKIPHERERLRMRVAQLFESDEIDENRLQMELVLLADKLDISEECVRMRSHIKFFNSAIRSNSKDPVGKKINFLLQEMNREINTIGSKCSDAEIAQLVVYLKEELERIREQIQNIE
ncbi:YicC/YloC family endoribonuclease [Bacteroidota bacterium]